MLLFFVVCEQDVVFLICSICAVEAKIVSASRVVKDSKYSVVFVFFMAGLRMVFSLSANSVGDGGR